MQFSHISQQRVKQIDARRSIVSNDVRPAFTYSIWSRELGAYIRFYQTEEQIDIGEDKGPGIID